MQAPSELNKLRFATIHAGKKIKSVEKDFHTIQNIPKSSGGMKDTELSLRYYLADWHFIALIEGEKEFLEKIKHALEYPHWHVYLGRKSFPPAAPFIFGNALKEGNFEELLPQGGDYQCYKEIKNKEDVSNLCKKTEYDIPFSFAERKFNQRSFYEDWVDISKIEDTIFPIRGEM